MHRGNNFTFCHIVASRNRRQDDLWYFIKTCLKTENCCRQNNGFALVSALVLIILGLVNIVAIQRIASRLPEGYRGILKARDEFTASRFSIQGKSHIMYARALYGLKEEERELRYGVSLIYTKSWITNLLLK